MQLLDYAVKASPVVLKAVQNKPQIEPTNRIFRPKSKFEAINLVLIERVCVQDLDIHLPLLKILGLDDRNAGRQVALHLSLLDY